MDLQLKHDLSLIDLTNYCNDQGFDFAPLEVNGKVKSVLFHNGEFKKEGKHLFNNWIDCQKVSYGKLYDVLTNKH